jgi:hypothetical protein
LLQQVNNQLVHDFLSQQNNRLFHFLSKLMDLLWLAETSQQPISQPNNLAEGHPPPIVTISVSEKPKDLTNHDFCLIGKLK